MKYWRGYPYLHLSTLTFGGDRPLPCPLSLHPWIFRSIHLSKLRTVLFNMQHPAFGIYSLTLYVSLIHILVFHLLTTLHKSDPHCHHHLCHHQSLLLLFTLDLKHTPSSSLFHRRLHHRYSLDWSHGLPAYICRLLSALYKFFFLSFIHSFIHKFVDVLDTLQNGSAQLLMCPSYVRCCLNLYSVIMCTTC